MSLPGMYVYFGLVSPDDYQSVATRHLPNSGAEQSGDCCPRSLGTALIVKGSMSRVLAQRQGSWDLFSKPPVAAVAKHVIEQPGEKAHTI